MEPATRSHHPLALVVVVVVVLTVGALSGPSMADQVLYAGQSLTAGLSLREGNYVLIMQADCNLVLYDGRAIWSSGTYGRGANCIATMQTDGNLVVYNGGRKAVWASNTYGATGNYKLVLQSDRNLVIYLNGGAVWATGTNVRGSKAASIVPISHAAGGGRNATAGPVAGGKGSSKNVLN